MLERISEQLQLCYEHAELAARNARNAREPHMRKDFDLLESSWLKLAASYQMADRVSKFIEWRCRRVEPPPDFEWPWRDQ